MELRVKRHEVAFGCCLAQSKGERGGKRVRRDIFSNINPNTWEIELTARSENGMDGGERGRI